MKASIQWSGRAKLDLHQMLARLQGRSPQAAETMAAAISRQVGRLERFPQLGRIVPEFPGSQPPLRELIIADRRLVYTYSDGHVNILTLFHGRRDFLKAIQH